MKSYNFRVVIEEDNFEDGREAYHAHCPALKKQGASTWGNTIEEALKNIQEVVQLIIAELIEDGEPIPEGPESEVKILSEPHVVVNL